MDTDSPRSVLIWFSSSTAIKELSTAPRMSESLSNFLSKICTNPVHPVFRPGTFFGGRSRPLYLERKGQGCDLELSPGTRRTKSSISPFGRKNGGRYHEARYKRRAVYGKTEIDRAGALKSLQRNPDAGLATLGKQLV
jgi:hypothetical protein